MLTMLSKNKMSLVVVEVSRLTDSYSTRLYLLLPTHAFFSYLLIYAIVIDIAT